MYCLLQEGLETEGEGSAKAFEKVLAEAEVPDTKWHLGNYEILEEIGRGGMGVIYRARQRHSRRIVALKRLLAYQADSHEALVRFRREAEAAAKLDHPNVLPIHEIGESEDGLPFFSMKYATGGSLRAAAGALRSEPRACVRLMAKVARAVDYAHGQGILHRDLQPGNILLDGRGEPLVSDFGLAKWLTENSDLTQTLTTFGTPGYIAPEQAESAARNLTPAADIYSLGAILFTLLTNRPPFVGPNVLSVIHQAGADPAPKLRSLAPSLDRDLETITAHCLERDPKARYQSAGDLAEDLERWLEGHPILARPILAPARIWRWSRRNPVLASAATACLLLVAAVIWLLSGQFATAPKLPPEKSIAVLPFQNLSDNKQDSDFGAGIQDDVLTSLAQIHDLKVISRTSVMAYQKPDGRNIREIGGALGVANVLEGSVRRAGNRVLVNVQLIDARNDQHLWAERYDRTVADSIGLQGELATQIVVALKATLAPEEKVRLDARPTTNSDAYVLYLTALGKEAADGIAAEQLYVEATAIDPTFALAHARASLLNSRIATGDQDRARKAKARAQAEEALRLSPALGEAHMALGLSLYWGEKKYDVALREFEVAAATSPNNAEIYSYIAGIYRRQGRWRESLAAFQRAQDLDPRNREILLLAANSHVFVRDWTGARAGFNRELKIAPDAVFPRIGLAYVEVFQNNSPATGRNILRSLPTAIDRDGNVVEAQWDLAMLERDYATAEQILADFGSSLGLIPMTFYKGRTALARGDDSAQRHFATAAPGIEELVRKNPDDPQTHALVALLYAYMQRKEDSLREGLRAVEMEPETQNAFHGSLWAGNLALVYALVGEQDQAITLIERLLSTPGPVQWPASPRNITLAELRLRWEWDSLRSNPRFQKILAGPEPKTILPASH
jgi:serine/threonine protein kinase/tetratricopeptide (TPR) repeat protein